MVKALKITILSLICIALVFFMIAIIKGGFDFTDMKSELIFEKSYELNNINLIDVNVKSSDIYIYESDDDNINIKVYGREKDKALVNEDENTLSIELNNKSNVCIGFCFGSRKIEIYVPTSYEGEFKIKATSADIKSDLKTYNDYNIVVTSGDIELNSAASLTGKATSGDLEINDINKYINFKATSGDIEIDNFIVNKNSSISVTSGDITIDKCKNAYIDASAKSGDIEIKNNDRHAEYELKINTTSGDIEIN